MGNEFQYLLETKRLVWLVAAVFAVFMMLQYFEFPYGDVVSSLFSASKAQIVDVNGSYSHETSFGNITHDYALNMSNVSNSTLQDIVLDASSPLPAVLLPPSQAPAITLPTTVNKTTLTDPTIVFDPNTSKPDKDASKSFLDFTESEKKPGHVDNKSSAASEVPLMRDVVTISDMHAMLVHNRASSRSMV